eukprot:TRINITY_DN2654_c0_g1_i4.p1 TRINITY_DN2654_c0_g1~~TRINITY_DN2654_c0_g1_i4.p1  ORF type:complete len:255 (-),score=66.80 TRINITY_DN2654_c0_g1_i4:55-819(-)
MRREFKRSILRRHQVMVMAAARSATNRGEARGRALAGGTSAGTTSGGGKRGRFSDQEKVAAALPTANLSADASTACAICLDESNPDRTEAALPCGHTYHGGCIRQWLGKSDKCPLCAAAVRAPLFAAAAGRGVDLAHPAAFAGDDVAVEVGSDAEEEAGGGGGSGRGCCRRACRAGGAAARRQGRRGRPGARDGAAGHGARHGGGHSAARVWARASRAAAGGGSDGGRLGRSAGAGARAAAVQFVSSTVVGALT